MRNSDNKKYFDIFDTIQVIDQPSCENLGEDSFYCANSTNSALISVCDGCGGLGARKYETYKRHTGAYIASRAVSGAIHDWYHKNYGRSWKDAEQIASSIDKYIRKNFKICEKYAVERLNIKGSLIRKFPTTLALAYAETDGKELLLHALWAGDSRVYLVNHEGLAQLSLDDTDVEDALENIYSDGPLTNVLSSDGNYEIHHKTIKISEPTIVFVATDGCFGYISSPMEFEYLLLKALIESKNPESFKKELRKQLSDYAGDDLVLGWMSYFYGNYKNTQKAYVNRVDFLEKNYIHIIQDSDYDENVIRELWYGYKPLYERYLR